MARCLTSGAQWGEVIKLASSFLFIYKERNWKESQTELYRLNSGSSTRWVLLISTHQRKDRAPLKWIQQEILVGGSQNSQQSKLGTRL